MTVTLTEEILGVLLNAQTSKALATYGPQGINVIPVSTVRVVDNTIFLFDYFFNKTKDNLLHGDSSVMVTFWLGLKAYQIVSEAEYITQGNVFDDMVVWDSKIHPDRIVKGIVAITPIQICDISIDSKV